MKLKQEVVKVGLKLNIQKTMTMTSGPITSLKIDGAKVETLSDFIFLGSKINVDGDCSHAFPCLCGLGKLIILICVIYP